MFFTLVAASNCLFDAHALLMESSVRKHMNMSALRLLRSSKWLLGCCFFRYMRWLVCAAEELMRTRW